MLRRNGTRLDRGRGGTQAIGQVRRDRKLHISKTNETISGTPLLQRGCRLFQTSLQVPWSRPEMLKKENAMLLLPRTPESASRLSEVGPLLGCMSFFLKLLPRKYNDDLVCHKSFLMSDILHMSNRGEEFPSFELVCTVYRLLTST